MKTLRFILSTLEYGALGFVLGFVFRLFFGDWGMPIILFATIFSIVFVQIQKRHEKEHQSNRSAIRGR